MRAVMYCSPRSGSTWLTQLLQAITPINIRIEDPVFDNHPYKLYPYSDADVLITRIYSHLVPYLKTRPDPSLKVIRLVRQHKAAQARSLILSDMFGVVEATNQQQVDQWREKVKPVTIVDEDVAQRAKEIAVWDQRTAIWACESKYVLNITYESLCSNPTAMLTEITNFLNLPNCNYNLDVPLRKLT